MLGKKFLKSCGFSTIIIAIFLAMITIPQVALSKGPITTIRPIEDFLIAQGTDCFPGGDPCLLFVPPIENFFGWGDPDAGLLASVDYAGLADEWLDGSLGTEFSGIVIERLLADGRVKVRVILHTSNALTWVVEGDDFATSPLIFGYRAPEVLDGKTPGLADSLLNVVFINDAPGAPLPDLMVFFRERWPDLKFLSFKATATGPLREPFVVEEDTPGKVKVKQIAILNRDNMEDKWIAEKIKVKKIRKKAKKVRK